MTFIRVFRLPSLFTLLLFSGLIAFTSCGDDEEAMQGCEGFPSLEGEVVVNGETVPLTIAQLLVSSAFGDTNYQFQIGGITGDCEVLRSVNFTLMIPEGDSVSGTYDFEPFFYAYDGDTFGSIGVQNISTLSQSSLEINSGTLEIVDNGSNNFTIDLTATPASGDAVSMSLTHQF